MLNQIAYDVIHRKQGFSNVEVKIYELCDMSYLPEGIMT